MNLSHHVVVSVDEQAVDAEPKITSEEDQFPELSGLKIETGTGVGDDGRVNFDVNYNEKQLSRLLQQILKRKRSSDGEFSPPSYEVSDIVTENPSPPALKIVIQVIGSRGDIQPFIVLGLELQKFKHRVRVATHPVFQEFVEKAGLEFFSIGGDPADLMSYMVRNPGLLPSANSIVRGEIQQKRRTVLEMMHGCWRSCIESGNGLPGPASPSKEPALESSEVFIADAIIANPPSFAHIHCAEKLGIPLHMMFTMPWTPTRDYAHPLVNTKPSGEKVGLTNYLSYALVEVMVWQGLGGVVNQFRRKFLNLEPIDLTKAPGLITRLLIPQTYLWSSELMAKPADWGRHITVAGFMTPLPSLDYRPPADLLSFLQDDPAPVYIGFGSIVVDDAKELTAILLDAVALSGVRAVISQGWLRLPEMVKNASIFLLEGDCPHGWLFEQVSCVVHHGGAGTTAAGIIAGKPTVVVPFFGDQFFWANAVARLGAGPQPIPAKELSATKLASAITHALSTQSRADARARSKILSCENGPENAARSFHDSLPVDSLRCSIIENRAAVWHHHQSGYKLSALAATVLVKTNIVKPSDLKLSTACAYHFCHGPWEPISGGSLAVTDLFYDVFKGIGEIGSDVVRLSQKVNSLGEGNGADINRTVFSDFPNKSHHCVDNLDKRVGYGTMKGSGRILKAAVRSPMLFSLGLAQGAHNAPLLWNDRTVRHQDNITGLGSGLLAGGKELFLGTYDGIAGLFLQPYIGARDGGFLGGIKGVAKGVASFPTKWFAAMSGTVGYPLKGLDVSIQRLMERKQEDPVIRARTIEGEQEYGRADAELRNNIAQRWISMTGIGNTYEESSLHNDA